MGPAMRKPGNRKLEDRQQRRGEKSEDGPAPDSADGTGKREKRAKVLLADLESILLDGNVGKEQDEGGGELLRRSKSGSHLQGHTSTEGVAEDPPLSFHSTSSRYYDPPGSRRSVSSRPKKSHRGDASMAKSVAGFHKSTLSGFDASCYAMGWDDGDRGKALEKRGGVDGNSSFQDVSHTPKQSSTRSKKTLTRGSSSSTDGIINLSPAMSSSRLAGSRDSSDNLYQMSCHTTDPFEVDASFASDEGSDEATDRSGSSSSFHRSQLPKVYRPKKSRGRESTAADEVINRPPLTSMLSDPPSTSSSVLSSRGSGGKLDHMTSQAFVVDTFTMESGWSSDNLIDAVVHGGTGKDAKSYEKRKNSLSSHHSADHLPAMANKKVAKRRSSGIAYSETILPGEKKRPQRLRSRSRSSDNLIDALIHGGTGKDTKSHDKRKNSLSSFHSADHFPAMANDKGTRRRSSGSVYSETILPGEKRSQMRKSSCAASVASDASSFGSLLREIYCTPEVFFNRNEKQRRVSGSLRKTKSSSSRSVDMMMDP